MTINKYFTKLLLLLLIIQHGQLLDNNIKQSIKHTQKNAQLPFDRPLYITKVSSMLCQLKAKLIYAYYESGVNAEFVNQLLRATAECLAVVRLVR